MYDTIRIGVKPKALIFFATQGNLSRPQEGPFRVGRENFSQLAKSTIGSPRHSPGTAVKVG